MFVIFMMVKYIFIKKSVIYVIVVIWMILMLISILDFIFICVDCIIGKCVFLFGLEMDVYSGKVIYVIIVISLYIFVFFVIIMFCYF